MERLQGERGIGEMGIERYRKRLIALVSALTGALALGLVAIAMGAGDLIPDPGPRSMIGWAVPLVALFVIVAVTWLLIARDSREVEDERLYGTCTACGQSVLREWRLCPYCGTQQREWHARRDRAGAA